MWHGSTALGWWEPGCWRGSLRCPVWDSFLGSVCLWAQSWVFTPAASGLNCSWKPSFWSTVAVCQFICHHLQLLSLEEHYNPVIGVQEHGPCHSKSVMLFAFFKKNVIQVVLFVGHRECKSPSFLLLFQGCSVERPLHSSLWQTAQQGLRQERTGPSSARMSE